MQLTKPRPGPTIPITPLPRPACPTFSPTSEPPGVFAGQLPERQLQGGSPNNPLSAPQPSPKSWNSFPAATNSHTPPPSAPPPLASTFPTGSHLLPLSALPAAASALLPSSHPRADGPKVAGKLGPPGCGRHSQTHTPTPRHAGDTGRRRPLPRAGGQAGTHRTGWTAPHPTPLAATPARCQGRTQRARGSTHPPAPGAPLGPLRIVPATWRDLGRARPRLPLLGAAPRGWPDR